MLSWCLPINKTWYVSIVISDLSAPEMILDVCVWMSSLKARMLIGAIEKQSVHHVLRTDGYRRDSGLQYASVNSYISFH